MHLQSFFIYLLLDTTLDYVNLYEDSDEIISVSWYSVISGKGGPDILRMINDEGLKSWRCHVVIQ